MPKIVLPSKAVGETYKASFDFTSFVGSTDTISSAVTTCTVYSGTDASPSSVISGLTTISGFVVTQLLTGGVNGVTYIVTCTATCTSGVIVTLTGYLAIVQQTT